MSTTTFAAKIARASVGLVVAGLVIGTGGTALADTPTTVAPATHTHLAPASGEGQDEIGDDAAGAATETLATTVTVTGSATGTLTTGSVSCTPLGDGNYSWQLLGTLDDAPIDITFTTAAFHGADTYKATGVTDDQGGLVTLDTGDVQVATNGANPGTFTIDAGEQTGSIDTDLEGGGLNVHVNGAWACS